MYPVIKRLLDIVVAALALIILSPLLLLLVLISLLIQGYPVFFVQQRPGLHGKLFSLYKFRTMQNSVDSSGRPLPDEQRLSRFGQILRASSLDELPELWNILIGDMSLVGPRPLLSEYLSLYSGSQRRRHEVLPGLTGWAQINGRNALSWEDKFRLDVWYVDHYSFWLDLKIIWHTVIIVLLRKGISAQGHVTMKPFNGEGS